MGRRLVLAVVAAGLAAGCATLSPRQPRFVVVFEQHTDACLIQVVSDTRSSACFVAFRCGRQPFAIVNADATVCEP